MEQGFDIHVVFGKKGGKQGLRVTQLEVRKSCDFLFLAPLVIGCLLIIVSVLRTNHGGIPLDTDSRECDLTYPS